ncbi:MAG: NAD(+) synthase [Spirochaetes bacterium]|nr:NAD(+) synthase [Spirochaetota bacterium]
MRLTPAVFDLDYDAAVKKIEAFIARYMKELRRLGIVVPLSGGLDSSTALAVSVRAVGADKVRALLLPDAKGAPDALRFGRSVAKKLGVKAVIMNTTAVNRAAGVYRFIANIVPGRKLLSWIVKRHIKRSNENLFIDGIRGSDRPLTRQTIASIYAKQRLRMVMTYRYAELNRLLVVGSAHKSEDLLGLFVKFGADDAADVMPFKRLFRTQVMEIARRTGVPEEVLARSPNPEMLPGIEDKYLDILGIPAPVVDLILKGLELTMKDDAIAAAAGVTAAKVAELRGLVAVSAHMRNPSLCPEFA